MTAVLLPETYYRQCLQAAESHWWFRGRGRIVETIVRALIRVPPESVILDVGSGPGGSARRAFPQGKLFAMDLSPTVLTAYRQADGRVIADAASLPCRPGSITVLCAFDLLEHLEDDRAALEQWWRVLGPGGWLVMTVPAYQALWSAHDAINHHRRRYRAVTLKRLLGETRFSVVRLTYFNTILLPAIALVRWAQRLVGPMPCGYAERVRRGELDCAQQLPRWLARWCEGILRLEAVWVGRGALPAGASICAVAQKPRC